MHSAGEGAQLRCEGGRLVQHDAARRDAMVRVFRRTDATYGAIVDAGFVVPEALHAVPGSNVPKDKLYDRTTLLVGAPLGCTGRAGVFYQCVDRERNEAHYADELPSLCDALERELPPAGACITITQMEPDRVNLSDPDVEPTDEQLGGLMRRAFANVEQGHQARLAERREAVRLRVATLRAELRAKHPSAFFR